MTSDLAIEAEEIAYINSLPKDCELCGEPSEYAKVYGCPCGYTGEDGLPGCPHDKRLRENLDEIQKQLKSYNHTSIQSYRDE